MSAHHHRDGTKFLYRHIVRYEVTSPGGTTTLHGIPWGMQGHIYMPLGRDVRHEFAWTRLGWKVRRVYDNSE